MHEIPRAAVIATHNRPAELRRCVEAIAPQVDLVVVVDNASDPPVSTGDLDAWLPGYPRWVLITDDEQPPNLSALWNLGLDSTRELMFENNLLDETVPRLDIAVLNDDAIPPLGWFDAVATEMRLTTAVAASADPFGAFPPDYRQWFGPEAPMSVVTRLAGWAFILRGEWDGARFDERFRWWCGDDDISHRARLAGGIVHLGGYPVPNTGADTSTTGALAEQAALDMQTFVDKWGMRPW